MTTEVEAQSGTPKRLYRSRTDRKVAGVLGGMAEYVGLDPSLIRIAYVIATVMTAVIPLTLMYVVMAFIIPREPKTKR